MNEKALTWCPGCNQEQPTEGFEAVRGARECGQCRRGAATMTDLKPCPFCGSDTEQVTGRYGYARRVQCITCEALGPPEADPGEAGASWNRALRPDVQGEPANPAPDPGTEHLIGGEFQSDKYPACPRGKVPLSTKDPTAQDLLWTYAQRRRSVDAQFSDDLEKALQLKGYEARDSKPIPDFIRAEAMAEIVLTIDTFTEGLITLSSVWRYGHQAFRHLERAEWLAGLTRFQWALAVHRGER